jgi:hypothetical protein
MEYWPAMCEMRILSQCVHVWVTQVAAAAEVIVEDAALLEALDAVGLRSVVQRVGGLDTVAAWAQVRKKIRLSTARQPDRHRPGRQTKQIE